GRVLRVTDDMSSGAGRGAPQPRVVALPGEPAPSLFAGPGPTGQLLVVTRGGALHRWSDRGPLPPRLLGAAATAAALAGDGARAALALPGGARLLDLSAGTHQDL